MDACEEMSCWFNLGSDEKTLKEYGRNAAKGRNFIYFDEQKYFKDREKEYGETVSAACPTVETSHIITERLSKKKSYELLRPENLVQISKKQQQQKRQIIAPKISRRRRKSL
jgi:hypothetical protein